MLELLTGTAGTGKSYEMMKRIKGSVPLGEKVWAIVPDQFNFEYNRMLYNFMGMECFNKMEVLSFSRLAGYIFTEYGGLKGKYADDTVRSLIMFLALSELSAGRSLNFYDRQAKNPRFINDALEFVRTFSVNGVLPETLAERTPFMKESVKEKAEDISLIYSSYTRLMEERGYKDSLTDISCAAAKARANGFFSGMRIFIDEFKSFTPDEYEMLEAVIGGGGHLTVCLTMDDGASGSFSVFEASENTAARLSQYARDAGVKISRTHLSGNRRFSFPELEFISNNAFSSGSEKYAGECRAAKIYRAAEPYSEADYVCAEINRLVSGQGHRYSDITVVSRCKENYSSILEAAFDRSGIPFYTDEKQKVSHKALVIFINTALRIISSKNISSEDMFRYIKTGYTGLDTEEAAVLEEYCYKWSAEGKMWLEPFVIWEKSQSGEAPSRDETAEKARETVVTPLEKLRRACAGASAGQMCEAVDAFLEETRVREQIAAFIEASASEGAYAVSAAREAKQLWEALCALLQTIYRTAGDTEMTVSEFASLFETAASSITLSSPPQTLDAVNFSDAKTARFTNPKAVFVIGAGEGYLPFAPKPSPLLSDRDIEALRDGGIEISGSSAEKLAEERFAAYAVISAASEKLYITYPSASVSGAALYPALAVKRIAAMFENDIVLDREKLGLLFFCTTERNGYYQYVQNFKKKDADSASLRKALEEADPLNKEKFEMLDRAGISSPHRLSGRDNIPERLFGKNITLSASRFEDYRKCPFVYFCKKGLRIFPREKVELNAPVRGNAVHYCLCAFLKEYDRAAFMSLSKEQISDEVRSKMNEYYAAEAIGSGYGKTKRFLAAFDRLADTVLDILINLQAEFSQSEFFPDSFEYTFSFNGDEAPASFTSPDGGKVSFTGAVDRVDVCDMNGLTYIRVVDYKTGLKELSLDDIYYGVNMQMLLYLFALTDPAVPVNRGLYHGALPAGVLYVPARDTAPSLPREAGGEDSENARRSGRKMDGMVLADLDIVKAMEKEGAGVFIPVKLKKGGDFYAASKILTSEQFEKLRRYSAKLLEETSKGIRAGMVEAKPLIKGNSSPCSYCDYSSVCGNFPNSPLAVRRYEPDAKNKMRDILNGEEESL